MQRGCTVDSLVQTNDGVLATMRTPDGPRTVRARYVVGADGMHSVVRQTVAVAVPLLPLLLFLFPFEELVRRALDVFF